MMEADGWNAYVVKGASDLGIVVVHEILGFNDYLRSVSDALAAKGYSAAAIDLFKGKKPATLEEGFAIRKSLTADQTLGAIRAAITMLKQKGAKKFGTMGFCMGGGFALLGACHLDDVTFCVDYYGSIENADDAKGLKGPLLLILASEDTRITPWAYSSLLPAATNLKKRVEVQLYPNAKHAFHNPTGASYNREAAEDSWQRTLDFLSRVK